MKRLFSILAILIILTSLPIYGATRLFLPNWLKEQIESKLPESSSLEIGSIETDIDLAILYENVKYSQGPVSIEFPNLVIEPRFSLQNPLILTAEEMKIVFKNNLVLLNDVQIGFFPKSLSLKDLDLEGSLGKLSKQETMFIQNMSFLISEMGNKKLDFKLTADSLSSKVAVPLGTMNLKMSGLGASINIKNGINTEIKSSSIDFLFTDLELTEVQRTLKGTNFVAQIDLEKRNVWRLPVSFNVKDVFSAQGSLSESLQGSATGSWGEESIICDLKDMVQLSKKCGKLINLLNVSLLLDNSSSQLEFVGDGLCVAPNSGCPQRINSDIRSKNTNLVFADIMKSGFLNPLVGGIILGSLLSSPTNEASEFEHEVNFKVLGSRIFLNDSPLIK